MLRIVFLLLLLGNAGYYLWSHDHLAGMGLAPQVQAEPQRLQAQINPQALQWLQPPQTQAPENADPGPEAPAVTDSTPASREQEQPAAVKLESQGDKAEAAKASEGQEVAKEANAAVKEAQACYQANGIEEAQADSIRRALVGKPKSDWELIPNHQSGRWMVYMGKFPDTEFLDRKRGELRLMNVDFDRAGGNFEPGLSLGRFSSEEAAQRQLTSLARQGVRTARVVQERSEVTSYALRLPKATATFRAEVAVLAGKNLVPKALQACSK